MNMPAPEPAAEPTAWNHVDPHKVQPRSAAARGRRLLWMVWGVAIGIAGTVALVWLYR